MRFCRNCGKPLEDQQTYCMNCGKIVDQEKAVSYLEGSQEDGLQEEREEKIIESKEAIKEEQQANQSEEPFQSLQEPRNLSSEPLSTPTPMEEQPSLNNWVKVLLSIMLPALPGLGPVIGIIVSIIFMSNNNKDRKTFGQALLTFSIIFLLIFCSCAFLLFLATQEAFTELQNYYHY